MPGIATERWGRQGIEGKLEGLKGKTKAQQRKTDVVVPLTKGST